MQRPELTQGVKASLPEERKKIHFISPALLIKQDCKIYSILRAPGIDPIEKSLLKQRLANLPPAQNSYIEKQKRALE